MSCLCGVRLLGKIALAAAVICCGPRVSSAADTHDGIEVYSDIVPMGIDADSTSSELPPVNFIEQMSVNEAKQAESPLSIAEPGALGLMALAGLMGGAVAMRRRLG